MARSNFVARAAVLFALACFAWPDASFAAGKRRKAPATPAAPEVTSPAVAPAPQPPPSPETTPAPLARAPEPKPEVKSTPASREDETPVSPSPSPSPRRSWTRIERIGVSLDYFSESSRMTGEQWINSFRAEESFDYSSKPLGGSLFVLVNPSEHWRFGPGIRFLGNHGGDQFRFGNLAEGYALGEFSLNAFEKFDAVFGGRAGFTVLFPGNEFENEIRRLQAERASVWGVPRFGIVAGLNVGLRRKIAGHLYGRFDFMGQLANQWLFATDEVVDGLRFQKSWSSTMKRFGISLAVEVAL